MNRNPDGEWRDCVTCNWPNGKYQHSVYCLPEREARAVWTHMPRHADRVQGLELTISASVHARSNVPTARLVKDFNLGPQGTEG